MESSYLTKVLQSRSLRKRPAKFPMSIILCTLRGFAETSSLPVAQDACGCSSTGGQVGLLFWHRSIKTFRGCLPWWSLVGLAPQTKLQASWNWNIKHFRSVEFLLNFGMSSPSYTNVSPPIEDFLVTVLYQYLEKCDNPLNPKLSEVSSLNGKIGYIHNVLCYSQCWEEIFFSLEWLPNTHESEKSMKET